MKYFTDCKTIEEAKKLYRKLSKELHPDLGGNAEEFKAMQAEYEKAIKDCMFRAYSKAESENKTGKTRYHVFEDILQKIIDWNIEIEIIGYWIYARNSYEYREQLKELGFWFSGKHKAWIFSGSEKRKKAATRMSLNTVRKIHGSERIRDKEERKKITA